MAKPILFSWNFEDYLPEATSRVKIQNFKMHVNPPLIFGGQPDIIRGGSG